MPHQPISQKPWTLHDTLTLLGIVAFIVLFFYLNAVDPLP